MWPWLIAGDDGRVAVIWYQTHKGDPTKFYTYAAYTTNAHGTTVKCSDGSKKFIPPQFSVTNASGRPIHKGKICLDGTTCNASADFEGGDRRLGDFFTVNFDHKGNIYIASGDTMIGEPARRPEPDRPPDLHAAVVGRSAPREAGQDPQVPLPVSPCLVVDRLASTQRIRGPAKAGPFHVRR